MARKFRFIVLLFLFFTSTSFGQTLPDILWDPDNPIFDREVCDDSSKTIYAKLNDKLTFLCGNPHINTKFKEQNNVQRRVNEYFYNIYLTNSYDVFINRKAGDSKATLIYNCHAEETKDNYVQYLVFSTTLTLGAYSPRAMIGFEEKQRYWFFTTSNGTKASLNNDIGDINSDMSIELHICKDDDPCPGRKRINACKGPNLASDMSSIGASKDDSGSSGDSFNISHFGRPDVLLTICFAVVIGIFLGFLLAYGRSKCKKEQDNQIHHEQSLPGNKQSNGHRDLNRLNSTNSQSPMLPKAEYENDNGTSNGKHASIFV